jgi:Ferritin-like
MTTSSTSAAQQAQLAQASALFSADQAALLKQHLQALVDVEFLTIPLYLTAVYSFTQAALNYSADGGKTFPLYDAQQEVLSVAVQEMLHLQLASNICNSFGVTPNIPKLKIAPGQPITVPHLEPQAGTPLRTTIGNLPSVMQALIAIETPDPRGFPGISPKVIYPSIADLYQATLMLLALYLKAYGGVPPQIDPHFIPNNKQINYATFATTYPQIHTIATRADVVAAANAICDQGEGGLIAQQAGSPFQSHSNGAVLPQFQPIAGSRFARWGALSHYQRFLDVQKTIQATASQSVSDIAQSSNNPLLPNSLQPMFYQANGVHSPDLPSWTQTTQPPVTAAVLGNSAALIWSYLTDGMQNGFASGQLNANSGQSATSPGFNDAMLAFKYITPLLWQYGQVIGYQYQPNTSGSQAQQAMDAADPLCLFHWDATTAALRKTWNPSKDLNACQGLNSCQGKGWGGLATQVGNGACATADMHTCGGNNSCNFQGGCAFLSYGASNNLLDASQQWISGANTGAGTGGCQTPISSAQAFASSASATIAGQAGQPGWSAAQITALEQLAGHNVWNHARQLLAQRTGTAAPTPVSTTRYDGTQRRNAVAATSK